MTVATFKMDLSKFAKHLDVEVEKVVRKISFEIYNGITQKTPVDTGRAKANWNIGFQNPNLKVDMKKTTFTPVSIPKGKGKHAIFITNNLPYIAMLENGSSKQAPTGMVAITMNDVKNRINRVIR